MKKVYLRVPPKEDAKYSRIFNNKRGEYVALIRKDEEGQYIEDHRDMIETLVKDESSGKGTKKGPE